MSRGDLVIVGEWNATRYVPELEPWTVVSRGGSLACRPIFG
jgi:hypothetical protein